MSHMRGDPNARLTILSEVEKIAVYGIPNFDDFQRIEFFAMTDAERSLALGRKSVLAQVYCLLQIGYFHRTRKALFEYDKLIRSIYTLRYLRDPQLQRDVHRSENRIESYHQLRSTIAQVNGKKELTGRTDTGC